MILGHSIRLSCLSVVFLAGCSLFDGGNGPRRLPEGHYKLGGRFDAQYAYRQYFVVLPDGRWDWVEYGYNAATIETCKVTRRTGTYSVEDSSLVLETEGATEPKVKCGLSAKDFRDMEMKAVEAEPTTTPLRAVGDKGFDAHNFFGSTTGWFTYEKIADPYGFYD